MSKAGSAPEAVRIYGFSQWFSGFNAERVATPGR